MTTETDLTRETIEHLDFDPPCGYTLHEGDASAALAVLFAPTPCGCRPLRTQLFCEPCWVLRGSVGIVHCRLCWAVFPPNAHVLRVEPLR